MEFANILMKFYVSGLREYLHVESLTVVFHVCTSVMEGIIFNMAANMTPKMAKFHFKNLLSYENAVVTKIKWFCQSMTCIHTQWRANNNFRIYMLFILFWNTYIDKNNNIHLHQFLFIHALQLCHIRLYCVCL